jgi:hypothetical protein
MTSKERDNRVPFTMQELATLLERFASAQTVTDVNIRRRHRSQRGARH